MRFIADFQLVSFVDSFMSLGAAFVLGTIIGAERQYRQRTAGLRTNVLVAVGAAAFADLATRVGTSQDAMRVVANVVTGVGFLGAGVIMKEGLNIRGLNTAATLWCSAAVGSCTGTDMLAEAVLITFIIVAGNTILRPLAAFIDRIPINERLSEITYEVRVSTTPAAAAVVRDLLNDILDAAKYPAADLDTEDQPGDGVDIVARLVSTAVNRAELDDVVERLGHVPDVTHATWEITTQN
ncbi:MgtC/SapB family protein [Xanthobacter agilis]|uniref:MgtC/SapB family protein n=1 Tax=Xanthobacter agilis TaxID=47492 RepID=UPI001EFF771C|nr:MgtC/SapB family protein [Xanthobacter agilis]